MNKEQIERKAAKYIEKMIGVSPTGDFKSFLKDAYRAGYTAATTPQPSVNTEPLTGKTAETIFNENLSGLKEVIKDPEIYAFYRDVIIGLLSQTARLQQENTAYKKQIAELQSALDAERRKVGKIGKHN